MNPRSPDGKELPDPVPCKACGRLMVFVEEGFAGRAHPIEWEGGANHFLGCPKADDFGKPKRPLSYCFKHRDFFHAKGPGCPPCREIEAVRREAEEWRTRPPLERFG